MSDLLREGAARFPDWTVSDGAMHLSFRDLERRSAGLASGLAAWGVQPGDHVAVWMRNSTTWLELWFAINRLGAIIVPLNTRLHPQETAYVTGASDSHWLVRGELPDLDTAALRLDRTVELKGIASSRPRGDEIHLEELRHDAPAPVAEPTDAVGMIQYTSGSTSFPKGAMLRTSSLIRNGDGLGRAWQVTEHDRVLCANPLFHCGGSVFAFVTAAARGASVRLLDRWSVDIAVEAIRAEAMTVFPGIDAMVRDLVAWARTAGDRLPSLRLVSTAADAALFADVADVLDVEVSNVYGLTESSPNVCVGDLSQPRAERIARIGRPQSGIEVGIRDPANGAPLPVGAVGEIVVRGWSIMTGYYGDDEATRRAFTDDGFLRTGDLGSVDDDGVLAFEGRLKQMIKSGGENVSIAEVEESLRAHPAVSDAVVVPVPDDRFGEVGFAYVAPLPGNDIAPDAVIEHARERLAGFKVPRHVRVVTELPRTGSGKVDRRRLLDHARAQAGRS